MGWALAVPPWAGWRDNIVFIATVALAACSLRYLAYLLAPAVLLIGSFCRRDGIAARRRCGRTWRLVAAWLPAVQQRGNGPGVRNGAQRLRTRALFPSAPDTYPDVRCSSAACAPTFPTTMPGRCCTTASGRADETCVVARTARLRGSWTTLDLPFAARGVGMGFWCCTWMRPFHLRTALSSAGFSGRGDVRGGV